MPKSPSTSVSPDNNNDEPQGDRLQKILAQAGIASRRKAEEIILEGRVQVNGVVVNTLGTRHDATKDHIRVDGKLLQGAGAATLLHAEQAAWLCDDADRSGEASNSNAADAAEARAAWRSGASVSGGAAGLSERGSAADDQRRQPGECAFEGRSGRGEDVPGEDQRRA